MTDSIKPARRLANQGRRSCLWRSIVGVRLRLLWSNGTLYDANVRAWRLAESARETQRHEAPGTELRLGKPATVPIRWGIARRAPVQGAMRRCGSAARRKRG